MNDTLPRPLAPVSTADAAARHRALAHPRRHQVLELLKNAPDGLDAAELARLSGLHPNTIRVHLATLGTAGLVEGAPFRGGGRGRPSIRYRATDPADEDGYRLLSAMLATAIGTGDRDGPSPRAEAAGRHWGRHLATSRAEGTTEPERSVLEAVTVIFRLLGFATTHEEDRIVLDVCPYRELGEQYSDVICGLHLGMLRGIIDAHGSSGDAAWLEPFVAPSRCVAGLSGATTGRRP